MVTKLCFFTVLALSAVICSASTAIKTKTYSLNNQMLSFADAQKACSNAGKSLAVIDSSTINMMFRVDVPGARNVGPWWVAGTDQGSEGNWYWATTKKPFQNGYTNWAKGQPDNYNGNQNCMVVGDIGMWYDESCSDLHKYACEGYV